MTTRVPCADHFHRRDDALRAHATQIDPDGFFFATPDGVAAATLADRGVRTRALPRVPTTLPEDDLFAGIEDFE